VWHLLAQDSGGLQDYLLAQWGIAGAVLIALSWFSIFMLRRTLKERDDLAARHEVMIKTLVEVVPLLSQATQIISERKILDERNHQLTQEVKGVLEDVRAELRSRR
jgi:hypothetical protein